MATKRKPHPDINQLASAIMAEATSETNQKTIPEEQPTKNPHAQALGRLGGLKGGKARAAKLSSEQRKKIASEAAKARWSREK